MSTHTCARYCFTVCITNQEAILFRHLCMRHELDSVALGHPDHASKALHRQVLREGQDAVANAMSTREIPVIPRPIPSIRYTFLSGTEREATPHHGTLRQ